MPNVKSVLVQWLCIVGWMQSHVHSHMIDSMQFKQWTKVDRASLETKILPVQDFLDNVKETTAT